MTAMDALFNYDIQTNATTNLIGSGSLDGNGIPSDFFANVHVRKAFNYAFDWTQYINQVYSGNATQRSGPIISGLLGYADTQSTYSYDPTQALAELHAAGGQDDAILTHGFTFTIAYNSNNLAQEKFCKILQAGIEALSSNFHIEIEPLDSGDYNDSYQAGYLPLIELGWNEDIPDPYNWMHTYMSTGGAFTQFQKMPADLLNVFTPKVNACVQETGAAAATCYADLQNDAYVNAIDIFLAQGKIQNYVSNSVQGYYVNPANNDIPYFYALSKSNAPVVDQVNQDAPQTVDFAEPTGLADSVAIPANAFTQPVSLVVAPGGVAAGQITGFRLGEQGFDISAFTADGSQLHPSFDTANPVVVTLHYNQSSLQGILPETLKLFYLNPQSGAWEDASCGISELDKTNQSITVPVCHFSRFALGGNGYSVYIPVAKR
jgi:hypothetical protein